MDELRNHEHQDVRRHVGMDSIVWRVLYNDGYRAARYPVPAIRYRCIINPSCVVLLEGPYYLGSWNSIND